MDDEYRIDEDPDSLDEETDWDADDLGDEPQVMEVEEVVILLEPEPEPEPTPEPAPEPAPEPVAKKKPAAKKK
ncbi:MAG TPA: flagella E, partial [Blastocatellia bacterium]|nr:flagella E [Blastocatellia bacterium]